MNTPFITGSRFNSIGTAATRIGTMVARFRGEAERLELPPAFTIDNVPFFTEEQVLAVEQSMLDATVRTPASDAGVQSGRR